MDVTKGVEQILMEGSREFIPGPIDLTGREIVDAGLADGIDNTVDYLVNTVGAVMVPVESLEGWDITGFAVEDKDSSNL